MAVGYRFRDSEVKFVNADAERLRGFENLVKRTLWKPTARIPTTTLNTCRRHTRGSL